MRSPTYLLFVGRRCDADLAHSYTARFRIKKKQWTLNLERTISDLSGRVEELERYAAAYWDEERDRWCVEAGEYEVLVANTSAVDAPGACVVAGMLISIALCAGSGITLPGGSRSWARCAPLKICRSTGTVGGMNDALLMKKFVPFCRLERVA